MPAPTKDGQFIEMILGAAMGHLIDLGYTDEEILAVVQVGLDKVRCVMKNNEPEVTAAFNTIQEASRDH